MTHLAHGIHGRGPERVLVLHDWLSDASEYDLALPFFDPAALTLARVDLPGYGRSRDVPLRGVDPASLDDLVIAVADRLGWQRFHLVAHSMSTVIAQRIARAVPARLASVFLATPVTPGTVYPDAVLESLRAVGREPARRREAFAGRWGPRLSTHWLDWKLARWAECSDPAAVGEYVNLFGRPGLATDRASTQLPVQVILGADDAPHFSRESVEPAVRAVYPDAGFEVFEAVGHYPMQETPPRYAACVERFVRAHPAG